jgi:replicative DNA helicase
LNTQFEKLLLSALLKDKQFLNESISYIDDDIFQNQYYRYFFFIIETYHKKCKDIIPYDTFIFLLHKTVNSQGFHKEESSIITEHVTGIFNTKYDINFIKEELSSHIKTRKFKKRLSQAIKDFDINKVENILSDLKNINKYSPDNNKPVEYVSSLNNRKLRPLPIPTKINSLDNKLSGGIAPGEFGLINAQTGGCKSTLLLNFAWGAVMDKKKVLFVTLEDSIETVMQRFDSLFSNLDFIIFRKDPDKSKTLLKKVEKHKNLLYIKDFTDGNFSVSKLSSIISSMKDIDIIILDYLDEIATVSKRDSRWQEVEDAARELKTLANETNIPIWTASQTAASSYGKEFVGLRDTYGGKGKIHIAHIVLTVCQTEDELKNNKLRLLVSKQKAGPKGGVISCNINLAKVRIWDANIL